MTATNASKTLTDKEQAQALWMQEMKAQTNALRRVLNNTSLSEIEILARYAVMWREVINELEAEQAEVTADNLLWKQGEKMHSDPCDID